MNSSFHGKWWCIVLLSFILLSSNSSAQTITGTQGDTLASISGTEWSDAAGVLLFSIKSNGDVEDANGDLVGKIDQQGNYRDGNSSLVGTYNSGTFKDASGDTIGTIANDGTVTNNHNEVLGDIGSLPELNAAFYFFIYPTLIGF